MSGGSHKDDLGSYVNVRTVKCIVYSDLHQFALNF